MKMPIIKSGRMFEVWRYTASHSQLLLRSNKGADSTTRLEILFTNVAFMAVPPVMRGMTIVECGPDELPACLNGMGISTPWYRIETGGSAGYVAAAMVVVNEDELEYHEPSALLRPPMV
jgi:hypothetical protein